MDATVLQSSLFFLLCLLLIPDSSIAEKPPSEAIRRNRKLEHQGNQIISSSLKYSTQLDATPITIPIINPTTPTTTTPIVASPPPPTTTTEPVTTPTTPTPTMPGTTPTTPTPTTSGGAWCIASPTASPTALQVALDYACGYGGADCSALQPGASCNNPNSVRDHASYAFNDYYQKNPVPTSCVFGGTAQLTYTDPSSGNCHYASPTATPSPSTANNPPPSSTNYPPPSSTNYPPPSSSIYPTTPSGPTEYGLEPTGSPNSADSASRNLLLLFTITCLSLLAENYI
uniref:Putative PLASMODESMATA CALLOSE-BINDING PROTEIN 1 n=1 Tax=Davidia involucrata TaxID=16924 RepID=A0A5B6YVP0_DAVIN